MSKFCWYEYCGKDIDKAKGFFGEVFGWTTQAVPMPEGSYEMIGSGGRTIGGYAPTQDGTAHWLSYLHTSDVKASAAQVTARGGKVVQPSVKVGEFGTMAVVTDPFGGMFALWQPVRDEAIPPRADNTFCWTELATDELEKSVAFYAAIGGFTDKPMPMGSATYHVLEAENEPRGGIGPKELPAQPHAWLPYVQVASADRTADKAKQLGGTILVPPTDVPNIGRFAILTDSQGAAIGILQP